MRRWLNWLTPMALAGIMLWMLLMPQSALRGARDGLLLFARNVLPALLPYFVLSQTLIASGAVNAAGRWMAPLTRKLFRLPGDGGPALLLGWISGSPSGARIAGQLLDQGAVDRWQATRLCACSALTGPLFLMGSVGEGMLGEPRAGALLLLSCLIAALLNGLVWRGYGPHGDTDASARPIQRQSALAAFPAALKDGAISVLAVGAGITVFSALIALLNDSGALDVLAAPLSGLLGRDTAKALLLGLVELTNGCSAAASLPLPLAQRTAILAGIAGFGGLSVAAQAALFLSGRAPMGIYLLQRLTQAALGYLCAVALSPLLLPEIPASTDYAYAGFCPLCIVIFILAILLALALLWICFPHRPWSRGRGGGSRRQAPCPPPASASSAGPAGSSAHRPTYPVHVSPSPQRGPPRR